MGCLAPLALLLLLPLQARAATPTADALVAKNAAARGGVKKLRAIQTLRTEGELVAPGGYYRMAWMQIKARPDALRIELSIQGLTQVSAWDGKEGWMINPFGGRKDPQRMDMEDCKGLIEEAPIDGALQSAAAAGLPITWLGTEDIDGTSAYKLEVSRPGGDVQDIYLDPDAYLEIRMVTRRTEHGATVEFQTDYADYEPVGGVFFPFLVEVGARDATTDRARYQVKKITPNAPLDGAAFPFPTTGSKP